MANEFIKALLRKFSGESETETFEITCAADWQNVPVGFFKTKHGLGYKSAGGTIYYRVGETVVDGLRRLTCDPKAKLPTVVFNFSPAAIQGAQRAGNFNVLDSDSLPGAASGETSYNGNDPYGRYTNDGPKEDVSDGLWGGGR